MLSSDEDHKVPEKFLDGKHVCLSGYDKPFPDLPFKVFSGFNNQQVKVYKLDDVIAKCEELIKTTPVKKSTSEYKEFGVGDPDKGGVDISYDDSDPTVLILSANDGMNVQELS